MNLQGSKIGNYCELIDKINLEKVSWALDFVKKWLFGTEGASTKRALRGSKIRKSAIS